MPFKSYSRKKRNNKNFRAVRVAASFALGTLGSTTWIISELLDNPSQELYAISADLNWSMSNITSPQGPIAVGLAHSDYSVAELKEWFQSTNTLTGDKIEQEESRRLARDVGIFQASNIALGHAGLNDGNTIRTRLRFRIEDGKSLVAWAANLGGEALSVTSPVVEVYGKAYVKLL